MERRHFLFSSLLAGIQLPLHAETRNNIDRPPLKPVYIPPSPPPALTPVGHGFQVKVRSGHTNTQFSCMEGVIAGKTMGPAPHIHKELDELMFVQEGSVEIMVGETIYKVEAGGWHLRPHGIVHTFWNATDKPARFIDMFFNQDFENFLEKMFLELVPDFVKRNVSPTSPEAKSKIDKLYAQYGITMFEEQRPGLMSKHGLTQ